MTSMIKKIVEEVKTDESVDFMDEADVIAEKVLAAVMEILTSKESMTREADFARKFKEEILWKMTTDFEQNNF